MAINENEVLDFLTHYNSGMSDYQIKNYIIKSEVTTYRQIKQTLVELNARQESIENIKIDCEKREINIEKIKHKLNTTEDEFDKRLLEIDLREEEKNIIFATKKYNIQKQEYKLFLEKITSFFDSKEELQNYMNNPEEERKYWIARMGKQAALDLLASGRITVGNMDSIAMMSEEDQVQTLKVAIQYSGLMNVGLAKLQQEMIPYLQELEKTSDKILPTFDGIENNLNINLAEKLGYEKKSIQSSNQSEDL
jgi:hypothetical protein